MAELANAIGSAIGPYLSVKENFNQLFLKFFSIFQNIIELPLKGIADEADSEIQSDSAFYLGILCQHGGTFAIP